MWKVESVYYPPAVREAAPSSSEVRDAPEEVGLGVILAIIALEEPARESEPSGVTETSEGQNPDTP